MAIVETGLLLQGMPQFCFQLIGFLTVTNSLIRLQICIVMHGLLRKLIQESILVVTLVNDLYIFGHTSFLSSALLMTKHDAHTLYTKYPFSITLIRDCVIKCAKTHVVINQMKKMNDAVLVANKNEQSEFATAFGTASYSQSSNGCVYHVKRSLQKGKPMCLVMLFFCQAKMSTVKATVPSF
jgi:hypothetical protein